ncbi:hypothetical protein [Spartinivicinus poritis]|uniref:Uncharacterized protein n=1 Tax=Spartinivicinus poritis TaxID=2994640 RepID=A0ABT5U418_9GAMM|nr:hypothetical protein [Spartinivicinus sp. A2-2]MDE1461105.1 hypothetical protein [Spartinivicinus sp. A2-2]
MQWKWIDYQQEFNQCNQLMMICINNLTLQDWRKAIRFFSLTKAKLHLFKKGKTLVQPNNMTDLAHLVGDDCLLAIDLGKVQLFGILKCKAILKLLFSSSQIDCEANANVVFRVMSTLGRQLNKPVMLVTEQNRARPIFYYLPRQGLTYLSLRDQTNNYKQSVY